MNRGRHATSVGEVIGRAQMLIRAAEQVKRAAEIAADCETGAIVLDSTDREIVAEVFGRAIDGAFVRCESAMKDIHAARRSNNLGKNLSNGPRGH